MERKISKIVSLALILALTAAVPAEADTVSDIVGEYGSYISSTGPGGEKTLTDGVLIYGVAHEIVTSNTGPGAESAPTPAESGSSLILDLSVAAPEISAEAAVLMDAATGEILYSKNASERLSPASTTKLLTALIVKEKLAADSVISFSSAAVNNLESGAATVGMTVGDTMTLTDALNAILVRSACDVAGAAAEAVSGDQASFAALMNDYASALGCTGSHFNNPTGLNDEEHYTTAYDMALIARAALSDETLRQITLTESYTLPAAASRDAITIKSTNKFVTGEQELSGYLGGKTGYTSLAGYCLATMFTAGGRKLIAVVLKDTSGAQYTDTIALAEYAAKVLKPGDYEESTPALSGSFTDTESGRKYLLSDGTFLTSQWLDIDGKTYFFDSNSLMCTGWRHFSNGAWYYFAADGSMVTDKWVIQDGKSYYMQSDGTMAVNTVIDGKYVVDENGVYVSDAA